MVATLIASIAPERDSRMSVALLAHLTPPKYQTPALRASRSRYLGYRYTQQVASTRLAGRQLLTTGAVRERDGGGLRNTFAEIETLAAQCRYRDCRHVGEPGCAVRIAIDEGYLPAERLQSLHTLEKELQAQAIRHAAAAQRQKRREWASISKAIRHHKPRQL